MKDSTAEKKLMKINVSDIGKNILAIMLFKKNIITVIWELMICYLFLPKVSEYFTER